MEVHGTINPQTGEYTMNNPTAKRPLENFLFNESYYSVTHHTGNGWSRYTEADGHYVDIVEGSNEPFFLENSRVIYLKDTNTQKVWTVGHYPVAEKADEWESKHGLGYTIVKNLTDGIEATWRIFVPRGDEPIEIWTLTIKNTSTTKRSLKLFSLATLSLECESPLYGHATYLNSMIIPKANGVAARKIAMNLPHNFFSAVFLSSKKPDSVDANYDRFTEQFRTLANPIAVENGKCSNSISSRDRIAGVLHNDITVAAGESVRFDYIAGAVDVFNIEKEAHHYYKKYLSDGGKKIDAVFKTTTESIQKKFNRIAMESPDERFNAFFNKWIPQLIDYGSTHCRWGLMGYRDIVQQVQGAVMFGDFEKKLARLERALAHQYKNGYAVRSYPADHEDSSMKYADSSFWLVQAVSEYVKESGDTKFLKKKIPFLDKGKGSVWEHLQAAMKALGSQRGKHDLCLIHEGDWNDSLTHVGRKGKGESVWLSEAFCFAALRMEELAAFLGEKRSAKKYRKEYEAMKKALNTYAWDGAWYIRAYNDKGKALGSAKNEEGKIYLNAQSWGLIAGVPDKKRTETMLKSVREHLDTPYGYSLLYPTYSHRDENVGRLSCIEPGCSENASVYTHANAFFAVGLLENGFHEEGFRVIKNIMPSNPDNPSEAVIPYQIANGYGGPDHRYDPGKAQYGWVTGSGSWLYLAVVDYLFGVRKWFDGIHLKPALPAEWQHARIQREFRNTHYDIRYERKSATPGYTIYVNDKEQKKGKPLPIKKGKRFDVRVVLG